MHPCERSAGLLEGVVGEGGGLHVEALGFDIRVPSIEVLRFGVVVVAGR
jgi:hypothetical protein